MAAVYSNALGLFNLTSKATPLGADLIAIGDTAVTGVPLKQATITSIVTAGGGGGGGTTIAKAYSMALLFGR
jgi:hypothetical protein